MLNSEFMVRNAKAFAARICESETDDRARVRFAVAEAFGRPAKDAEVEMAREFLAEASADEPLTGWQQYAQALLGTNEFMFVD